MDLAAVASRWGAAEARRLWEGLTQLAPDLMQQHLGSDFRGWNSYATVVLTDETVTPVRRKFGAVRLPDRPVLALSGPASAGEAPGAYLTVTVPERLEHRWQALPRWCWRADAVADRREAYLSGRDQARADTEALRSGRMSLADLHPLVYAALHPGQVQPQSEYLWYWPQVRVRCAGTWHRVQVADGGLALLDHAGEQVRREAALAALGGPVQGCMAVRRTWYSGQGRLPGDLHRMRQQLFEYAVAGHTEVVVAMLDAGFDPAVVDGNGRNLLHYLSRLDHVLVLPRLLAAGLQVNGQDRNGATALHLAAHRRAGDVMAALIQAGANPGVVDNDGLLAEMTPMPWRREEAAYVRIAR
ncbi:hypothetical protein GCM10028775_13940 [Catellatospora paridis]